MKNTLSWAVMAAISVILFAQSAFAQEVESVRSWRAPDNTRVVFDLSRPGGYNAFELSDPQRLVIDFDDRSSISANLNSVDLEGTPIVEIRSGFPKKDRLRIVLELKQKVDNKHFLLSAVGDKKDRLVVDLYDKSANTGSNSTPVTITEPTLSGKRDILIIIDPGHGGEDPGAIGQKRVYEKNVVLAISKKLKQVIDNTPGYRAELTRSSDYGVEHKQRREFARSKRADLFLSIHADALPATPLKNRKVHGASVFALDPDGRRSQNEITRYLVQRENEADLIGGFDDINIKQRDEMVARALIELSLTSSLISSLEVGADVLGSMDRVAKLHSSSVQQADFAVLRSLDVPSLLIETGFISNPDEESHLNTAAYQQKMANSIFAGIQQYFYRKPPLGTYVAWTKSNNVEMGEHVIQRGESLSAIAQRYRVSVSDIMALNGMATDRILVGQRLKIPSI